MPTNVTEKEKTLYELIVWLGQFRESCERRLESELDASDPDTIDFYNTGMLKGAVMAIDCVLEQCGSMLSQHQTDNGRESNGD